MTVMELPGKVCFHVEPASLITKSFGTMWNGSSTVLVSFGSPDHDLAGGVLQDVGSRQLHGHGLIDAEDVDDLEDDVAGGVLLAGAREERLIGVGTTDHDRRVRRRPWLVARLRGGVGIVWGVMPAMGSTWSPRAL